MKTSATFPHDSSKIPRHLPRTRFPDEWSYVVTLLPIRIHWWLGRPVGRTTSTTGGGAGDHAAAAARDRPTAVVGDAGIVGGRAGPGGRSLLSTRTSAQVLATPCSLRASHRYSASSSTVTESMIRRQTPSMYSSRMWALDASVLPSCANEQPNDHVTGHPHHRCKKKRSRNYTVATIPSIIMPPPTCDKAENCISGHIWPQSWLWPLTFRHQKTIPGQVKHSDAFSLAPKSVSGKSLVKFRQQIPKMFCQQCLFGMHERTNTSHEQPGNIMLPATMLAKA